MRAGITNCKPFTHLSFFHRIFGLLDFFVELLSFVSFFFLFLFFVQGKLEKGLALIQEGIAMRKSLGGRVRLYVAAGYCDLGSEYFYFKF